MIEKKYLRMLFQSISDVKRPTSESSTSKCKINTALYINQGFLWHKLLFDNQSICTQ